jgi:hypothetical protein
VRESHEYCGEQAAGRGGAQEILEGKAKVFLPISKKYLLHVIYIGVLTTDSPERRYI